MTGPGVQEGGIRDCGLSGLIHRVFILALLISGSASSADDVIERVGEKCPTGTYMSGDYCKMQSSSKDENVRVLGNASGGKCPIGWYRSGDYCKSTGANHSNKQVIQKVGDRCPTGMYSAGNFCKSFR